jgi:hypothetical protein
MQQQVEIVWGASGPLTRQVIQDWVLLVSV